MSSTLTREVNLEQRQDHLCGYFQAMASPCEVLIDIAESSDISPHDSLWDEAYKLVSAIALEAWRIEDKYSRYRDDNIIYEINHAQGRQVEIDSETFELLNLANTCYELSQGRFDITSGILGKVWQFDGSANLPSQSMIDTCLACIGWHHVTFNEKYIHLLPGFALDLGGIGKEYAVDKCIQIARQQLPDYSVLINFGGDISVTKPRKNLPYWQVGIEHPNPEKQTQMMVKIAQGGLATSGDAKRYLLKDGVRYGHVLSPHTGYPVMDAPRSVTVAGENCTQAGLLATLALLQGAGAESFLKDQQITHWCLR